MRSPLSPLDFLGMPLLVGLGTLALVSCSGGHKVAALFPKHEIEPFTELFWRRVQAWRADEKAA